MSGSSTAPSTESAVAQAKLNLALGTSAQSAWAYLTSAYPDHALTYRNVAYAYAQDYPLEAGASLGNHSFEVDFAIQLSPSVPDADPKDIITDFLTNADYGVPGWKSGLIGDLSTFSTYCRANNLLLSPVLEEQRPAREFINQWTEITNCAAFWSEGVLKIATYGDASATANGSTFTPNLTPVYALTEDDLQPLDNGAPVKLEIKNDADAFNIVQVEFLDRSNNYNVGIAQAFDDANIADYGNRKRDPVTWHEICNPAVARNAAQLFLQRVLFRREVYSFKLPWNFAILDPMDYVSLTTTTDQLKLNAKLVQIVSIDEGDDGYLDIVAEGVLVGSASAPIYNAHSGSQLVMQTQILPGSVSTPVIINAPPALTGLDPEVWVAVAGTGAGWGGCQVWVSPDGTNYQMIGAVFNPAKIGVSTSSVPVRADPDTLSTLGLNMAASKQTLTSTSDDGWDQGATLFILGNEVMSYKTATLTGANAYNLTSLHRGLYGTAIASHSSGEPFAKLDEAVFKFAYADLNFGATMYLKFPSFNAVGNALQDLSDCTAYTLSLLGTGVATNWRDATASADMAGDKTVAADYTGAVTSTNLAALVWSPRVFKGGTSIKGENTTSYALSNVYGVTGGTGFVVDNTNGSSSKGDITIASGSTLTNIAGGDLTITVNGIALPKIAFKVTKILAPAPSGDGGGGGGGSGTTISWTTGEFVGIDTTSYTAIVTPVKTITLTSGQSLYGTAPLDYIVSGLGAINRTMTFKWQYAVAGSGSWNDFGAGITGDWATSAFYDGETYEYTEPYPGSVAVTQTKSGLSAGDYDIRMVALCNATGRTCTPGGTATMEAKV